jgi:hypothetical protein
MADDEAVDEVVEETPTVPDTATMQAKIDELTLALADRDVIVADLSAQVVAAKAANYDLLMQIPGTAPVEEVEETDDSDIDVSDLFGEDEDK